MKLPESRTQEVRLGCGTISGRMAPGPASDAGSETASEPEDALPVVSPPSQPKPAPPAKGRLGQIGGKAKPSSLDAAASPTKQPPRRRIGAIGKRPAAVPVSPKSDEVADDRANEKSVAEEAEKPCETPADRADRRRVELRNELDKKAVAGPAKKKRKF